MEIADIVVVELDEELAVLKHWRGSGAEGVCDRLRAVFALPAFVAVAVEGDDGAGGAEEGPHAVGRGTGRFRGVGVGGVSGIFRRLLNDGLRPDQAPVRRIKTEDAPLDRILRRLPPAHRGEIHHSPRHSLRLPSPWDHGGREVDPPINAHRLRPARAWDRRPPRDGSLRSGRLVPGEWQRGIRREPERRSPAELRPVASGGGLSAGAGDLGDQHQPGRGGQGRDQGEAWGSHRGFLSTGEAGHGGTAPSPRSVDLARSGGTDRLGCTLGRRATSAAAFHGSGGDSSAGTSQAAPTPSAYTSAQVAPTFG